MKVTNAAELSIAVREARTRSGISQTQLAQAADVSREWVSRLENGSTRLEIEKVLRTVSRLGITLETTEPAITKEDIEMADSLAWEMGLEAQDITAEAYDHLVKRIAARRVSTAS